MERQLTEQELEDLTNAQIKEEIENHQKKLDSLYNELQGRQEKLINEAQARYKRAKDELHKVYQETNAHGTDMRSLIGILNNNF
tara:strand:+ start:1979 stop:2230 length:252 start_codon:yes stop_codon:yes gene_type:complete